ncbi:MAG: hypothetical protein H7Z21_20255 [Hymenobacter sp.]|nr:hypothetical protein [Hymenobacter sp.]
MQTFQVNVLNPKAVKLLRDLADLNLITRKSQPADTFQRVVQRLREKAAIAPPSLDDIAREVEMLRARRYAKR